MRRVLLLTMLLILALPAFAEPGLRGHPAPGAPQVERHSALARYPHKTEGLDQLSWADFSLQGRVRKMYVQTSDIIWEPGSLKDHVIVRFDSLGRVQTSITYPHNPLPQGYRYHYSPDGQLDRVERYAYQDGFDTGSPDQDNIYPAQGNAAEYYYDDQGYLTRIVFYDEQGLLLREHLYNYTADGYSIAINHAVETRRNRNQLFFYDRQGKLVTSQKKNTAGKFIITAKYSFDAKTNTMTSLQDYLNDAPTQKNSSVYDSAGRLKDRTINDPQGNLMRKYVYSYDSTGRLTKEVYTSPNDKITTTYSYKTDSQRNLAELISSRDNEAEPFRLTIRYEYY